MFVLGVEMSVPQEVKNARHNVKQVLNVLNSVVIGHDEVNTMLVLALIAKEHAVMISPPGTAKTMTIKTLAKLLNASFYSYLLTKFTSDIEILGPFDIPALRERGDLVRKWTKIKDAEIVFLDEVFKANSAILNALLALMQERILYDPMSGAEVPAKLWSLFGASNEVPQDEELQALYDRFSIRIFFDYLNDDVLILKALEARWLNGHEIKPVASMDDVRTLHGYTITLIRSRIRDMDFIKLYHVNVINFVKELRAKGIIVSDRTIIEKLPKLLAAYLALFGVRLENVMEGAIKILPYLARDRSEHEQIKKIIMEGLGEVGELAEKLSRAKELIRSCRLDEAEKILQEIVDFDLNKIANKPWLKPRAEAIIAQAREYLNKVAETKEMLKKLAGNT